MGHRLVLAATPVFLIVAVAARLAIADTNPPPPPGASSSPELAAPPVEPLSSAPPTAAAPPAPAPANTAPAPAPPPAVDVGGATASTTPAETPAFYERPWVWTIIGVVIVTTVAIMIGSGGPTAPSTDLGSKRAF
jgi:hypothetical protein